LGKGPSWGPERRYGGQDNYTMVTMVSRPMTPMTPTTGFPQVSSGTILRRTSQAGTLAASGVLTPQPGFPPAAYRIVPPSGASTPAMPVTLPHTMQLSMQAPSTTCPSCGNVYMADALFCRHCGQKREVDDSLSGGSVQMHAAPYAGYGTYGTHMVAEPTTLSSMYATPLSISIPASSSYVPPAGGSMSAPGYVASRASSYVPPAMQVPTTLSYQPPVLSHHVVRRISGASTPGMPGPGLGYSVSTASLAPAPVYVAAATREPPRMVIAREDLPAPVEPEVPPSLTAGLPDPGSIDRQKSSYAKGLEEQLRHGTDVLAQQLKQQSDYLFAMGDQRKRQYALQIDQEIKQREMELAQQHNEQLLLLQQAAQQQKSALEHQANALLLEFNQKKAAEDLQYQQYQFQKRQYETQLQYNDEMKDLQVQQAAAAAQVAHQKVAIAQQAVNATQQAAVSAHQANSACKAASKSGYPPLMPASSYGPAPPTGYSMSAPTGYSMSVPPYVPGTPPQVSSSFIPVPATNLQVAPTNYGSSITASPNAYWSPGN